MDAFEGTSVPGTEGASLPFFSPDGQWVGFLTASRMKKVPVEGGSVVEIMSITDGGGRGYMGHGRLYLRGSFLERGLVAGFAKRRKERDGDFSRSGTQGARASLA
jgi:hypothetical protein